MPRHITRQFIHNAPAVDVRKVVRVHGKAALEAGRVRVGDAVVRVVFRSMNFGGARPYFLCPSCDGRVLIVYARRPGLMCRECAGLNYWSQAITGQQRRVRRIARLRERLGAPARAGIMALLPPRPRGMHRSKYRRLVSEIADREQRHFQSAMPARVLRWLGQG